MKLTSTTPTVYLIHFLKPYKHARHYLGYSTNLDKRITDHLCGTGARLLEVVTDAGIEWRLVRTWPGDRELERQLKNRKDAPRLCPICNPDAMSCAIFTAKGDRDQ
jgi:predicted GIY-YIG superfamily endonuclease